MQREQTAVGTRISLAISEAMERKGLSIRDLSDKIEITYEHMRRVVRGECVPSRFVLKAVSAELGLNFKELESLATADKISEKFGGIPMELAGKKPGMEPLEKLWDGLTASQQRDLIAMAQTWYSRNRAERTT